MDKTPPKQRAGNHWRVLKIISDRRRFERRLFDVGRVTYEIGGNHTVNDMCNSISGTYLKHLIERIREEKITAVGV